MNWGEGKGSGGSGGKGTEVCLLASYFLCLKRGPTAYGISESVRRICASSTWLENYLSLFLSL